MTVVYGPVDRARRVVEPPKRAGAQPGSLDRDDFARDRARVLHSYAFRRLADKTQVVVPGEDDFPRTRLTHSLEVAQIGRELAVSLGCDADIVDTAGLAHDIGHPPFGHNGEAALDAAAGGCGGFEGNAQTLRLLTRLEAKVLDADGRPSGLNLTRAVLDATCKYPWRRDSARRKFGVYADDLAAFAWVRDGRTDERRSLEAQVMDWADDVAYSVHDVEDGIHAGMIELADLDDAERQTICTIAADDYSPMSSGELAPLLDDLLRLPTLRDLAGYDGSLRAQAAAKRATSELTGRLCFAAVRATREIHGDEPLQRYDADVVVPATIAAECALLKAIAVRFVLRRDGVEERQTAQRALLTELVAAVADDAPRRLDRGMQLSWHEAEDDPARLRVVIDQVAQLTDSSAIAWHERLVRPIR